MTIAHEFGAEARLPDCPAYSAVIAYLQRDLELLNFLHKNRN